MTDLERMRVWIWRKVRDGFAPDGACAQCFPHSKAARPGFECVPHLVLRLHVEADR